MRRLALVVALLGLPGLAVAAIDNSALECGADHTYFPRGDHWAMTPPASAGWVPVLYSQQKDGAPGVPGTSELTEVRAAFNTWMSVTCPGGGHPNVVIEDAFEYNGTPNYETRDTGDVYECDGGGVCGEDCSTDACNLVSTKSIIYFVTSNWPTSAGQNTVALTTNLYARDTGFLVSADMEFNAVNFNWRTDSGGCSGSDCFHVESVALHEAGHFLGFNHVQCSDAVMFPQGSGTTVRTNLSAHEIEGLCTIYAPRSRVEQDKPDVMEQCSSTSQCPSGLLCIKPGTAGASSPFGWCTHSCTTTDNCDTGFVCVEQEYPGTQTFCRPGAHDTGGAVTGGNGGDGSIDPETGEALDLCTACTSGDQCSSGVCMSDGTSDGICTRTCVAGTVEGEDIGDCPSGMTCVGTDQDWSVCWPETSTSCGDSSYRAVLNEICFDAGSNASSESDDYYRPCGPDLICFGFKPRCAGQQGACVQYCNASDPCQDGNLSCCYGVDDLGNCLGSTAGEHGGCFDIRLEGESCVTAEQSICESGAACFHFGDPVLSKCYGLCPTVNACRDTETCMTFSDACYNQFSMCCDDDGLPEECLPGGEDCLSDVGVACRRNEDCDSGMCLSYDGHAACSRWCNPVTGVGCPGDVDVNGDGLTDGGFRCVLPPGVGEGRCWPATNMPADPPACAGAGQSADPPSGCCNATGLGTGDVLLGLLLWVPLVASRFRRRRLHPRQ